MAATAQQLNPAGAHTEKNWKAALLSMDPALLNVPAAHADAVVTVAAAAGRRHVLCQVRASYSAAPAAGSYLKVEDGGVTIDKQYIAAGGPFEFNYDPPLVGTVNSTLVVTLVDGGAGISGSVQVSAYDEL